MTKISAGIIAGFIWFGVFNFLLIEAILPDHSIGFSFFIAICISLSTTLIPVYLADKKFQNDKNLYFLIIIYCWSFALNIAINAILFILMKTVTHHSL